MRDYREKARAAKGQSEIKRQQKLMLHSPIPVPKRQAIINIEQMRLIRIFN